MRLRIALAASLLAALGCRIGATPIREILDEPGRFDGRRATVAGEVVDSANLLVLKFYKVRDATGTIAVVTPKAVPKPGARVRATGTVHQAFALGKDQLTVLVEDE
jgi:hypothetical protein